MILPERKKYIINSLLDTDFYNFTMGQLVFHQYPGVNVRYEFTNRTKSVKIGDEINIHDLADELDHVRRLRFDKTELHYLRGTNEYGERMFKEDYLEFLENFQMPGYFLEKLPDGQLKLGTDGSWQYGVYWETVMLPIITELRTRKYLEKLSDREYNALMRESTAKFENKVERLIALKESGVNYTLSEYGTRRRASYDTQDHVVVRLRDSLPTGVFRGTSNVLIAMRRGVTPMGTNAHQLGMVLSAKYYEQDELDPAYSQRRVLEDWEREYPSGALDIMLPDTFGSDWFLENVFTEEHARLRKGPRQDSGNPVLFASNWIKSYKSFKVDPKSKLLIFSDGLDLDKIESLGREFHEQIQVSFGPGTNFTNDIGLDPASVVIKPVFAEGHDIIKLSDDLGKELGSPIEIARRKRLNNIKNTYRSIPKY